jgi:beta-mannanase
VVSQIGALDKARQQGWSSGASGQGVKDNSFSQWRGSPVTIAGTWADTKAEIQESLPSLSEEFKDWSGDIDIAVGGTELHSDESYSKAAQGAYLNRWTTMAQNLQRYRGNAQGTTYVRPFHEFNGDWYENWFVTPENVEDYKKSFRLITQTIRQHCQGCAISWSPNNGSSQGAASIDSAYPGDDVVDVVSIDSYNANGNPIVTDQASWDKYATDTKGNDPVGVEAWRQFAERHGKPIAFSEWGLNPDGGGGDNPEYIKRMNAWMTEHAARPGDTSLAGKVLYDVYFNVRHGGKDGFLIKDGPNKNSGQVYTGLRWGTAGHGDQSVAQP